MTLGLQEVVAQTVNCNDGFGIVEHGGPLLKVVGGTSTLPEGPSGTVSGTLKRNAT